MENLSWAVVRQSYKMGIIYDVAVMRVFDGELAEHEAKRYIYRRFEIPANILERVEYVAKPVLERGLLAPTAITVKEMPKVTLDAVLVNRSR